MKGFTLVETLIATALLGTMAAAGLTGLLQASTAAQQIAAEQTQQERAAYALATLAADIQMAGYFGFAAPAGTGAAAMPLACGAELLRGRLRALEVQPQYTLSCAAFGRGSAPGSPVLVLRRASTQATVPQAGRLQWYSNLAEPEHNRLLWNGALPSALLPITDRSEVRNLIVRAFYIAHSSDGDIQTPSLRVKSLTAIAGHPAFIDTEVMPGVVSLQVEPMPDASHPTAVRIVLGLQRESVGRSGPSAPTAASLFTRHLALRNVPED